MAVPFPKSDQPIPEPPRPLMRELPPATEYPIDALGPIIKAAVEGIRDKTQAATALCSQSVLAASALAAQAFNDVELPTGTRRPLSLFLVSVAASGDRKSSADDIATWPLRQREESLREAYGSALQEYTNAELAWSKAREQAIRTAKGDHDQIKRNLDALGSKPKEPLAPILTASDPTFEGLCKLLFVGQPSVGVFADEGGQFISGHAMNADNRLKTAAGFSTLWDSGRIKRVRAGDGHAVLVGRRVSMHLLAQPNIAAEMLGDSNLADQGLLSRILVAAPESTAGTRFWKELNPNSDMAIKQYGARVLDLLDSPFPLIEGKANELAPHVLSLSPLARRVWIEFSDFVEAQVGPGGQFSPIRGFAGKAPEHAARIAGVIATVERELVGGGELQKDDLDQGILIAQFHMAEAVRLFEAQQVSPDLFNASKLLAWLQHEWKGDIISLPDIYQKGPNAIREKSVAEKLVGILVDHGWLKTAGPGQVDGKQRKETFRILEAG